MSTIEAWVASNEELLLGLGAASLALLAITLIALPFVVAQLPEDYFTRERRHSARKHRKYPLIWSLIAILQNILGVAFVLAGIAMLVLPGQGLITILIGLALTNFPGKYDVERRILQHETVAKSLNKIRELAGRPPLKVPSDS